MPCRALVVGGDAWPALGQCWTWEGCWHLRPVDLSGSPPMPGSYHALDAFREEEAVVQGVHGVIREHLTLPLEQEVPSVQAIVRPEDGKPPFLIPMNEGPRK